MSEPRSEWERPDPGIHRSTAAVPEPPSDPGPLHGLRVVELASEYAAFCGRLLADFGAEVILVEPPGGAPQRHYEPFVDDVPDPERSLYWWHYHSNKYGVMIDLDDCVPFQIRDQDVARVDRTAETRTDHRQCEHDHHGREPRPRSSAIPRRCASHRWIRRGDHRDLPFPSCWGEHGPCRSERPR